MNTLETWEPESLLPEHFDWPYAPFTMLRTTIGTAAHVEHRTDDGDYVIRAELPGLTCESVEVTVAGHELRVHAEPYEPEPDDDGKRPELHHGPFTWSLILPAGIDSDAIRAKYDQGALTIKITMPEAAEQESERIAVQR